MSLRHTLIHQPMQLSIALMNWIGRHPNRLLAAKYRSGFFFGVSAMGGGRIRCVEAVASASLNAAQIG